MRERARERERERGREREYAEYDAECAEYDAEYADSPLRARQTRRELGEGGILLHWCVSLFYVNDIGSTGSRGRTVGIPCVYPSP